MVARYRDAPTRHLVWDHRNTQGSQALPPRDGEKLRSLWGERFPVHDPPQQGRWLHPAAIAVRRISRWCLAPRRIPDRDLRRDAVGACGFPLNRDRTTLE
jgi:hypothetical protein